MRTLVLITVIAILASCNSHNETAPKEIDEIGFHALQSIKEDDKQKFLTFLDPSVLAQTPPDQIDTLFVFYRRVLADYDFPEIPEWKKNRVLCQVDTSKKLLAIGFPLIHRNNSKVDLVFEMQFSPANKITAMTLNKTAEPAQMPDFEFPAKEEKFNYSFDSLLSIRLYHLPGMNADPNSSRSITIADTEFTDEIKSDFGNVLSDLNKSPITGAEKTISQQSKSNNLKAVIFRFRDNGKVRSLFLISNDFAEKPLEIHVFYMTNAAYAYQVNDISTVQLKSDINLLIEKYIK